MKFRLTRFLSAIALCLLATSCSDDEGGSSKYAVPSTDAISLGAEDTEAVFTVEWSRCSWQVAIEGEGFLTGLSTAVGGNANGSGENMVTVYATTNGTQQPRSQDIALTNLTTDRTDRITVTQSAGGALTVTVATDRVNQHVVGFGGMLNPTIWVAASDYINVDDIDLMYGPGGLGYNILRLMVYDDRNRWGDDIETARRAQSYGALLLASPWYPPAELEEGERGSTSYLPESNYAAYARHLKEYTEYMAANGVTIDVMSIQNEPDMEFTSWTIDQIYNFVRDYGRSLGDVKVMAAESFCFNQDYTDRLLNNDATNDNFDIVGAHIYGHEWFGTQSSPLAGIRDYPLAREKGKEVWMTEYLMNEESDGWDYDTAISLVAQNIHDCMEANFNTYIWWYLKRYYSMIGDSQLQSPVGAGEVTKRGYVLSHYARYATGRDRVTVNYDTGRKVLVTAYLGEGDITFVLVNLDTANGAPVEIVLPSAASAVTAVETTASADMAAVNPALGDDKLTLSLELKKESVVSVKVQL